MRKRTTVRLVTYLSATALVLGIFAYTYARRAKALEYYARANTSHAFEELVTGMSELSTSLQKSIYVTDPALESALCTQIFGRAVSAQMAMGVLPYADRNLEQTASFLADVGDYACVLSRTVGTTGGFDADELENLRSLSDTASIMVMNLQDMQSRISAGELTLDELCLPEAGLGGQTDEPPLAGEAFQTMEEQFPELPTLIYDGPFSQGHKEDDPAMLSDTEDISESEAVKVCSDFLDMDESQLSVTGEIEGKIPCYVCSGNDYTVFVTKQGGMVMSALADGGDGVRRLSPDSALSCADKFMRGLDFDSMERSYYMIQGNTLTANYEYSQKGVTVYPDLIKVSIALDDGSLAGYDATGYISAHKERELPNARITEDEACLSAGKGLTVRKCSLAVIPSDGGEERLCHELLCEGSEGERCLIYVNAQTGAQERILLLLEDDNGTLTI